MKARDLKQLLKDFGQKYSEVLDIDLKHGKDGEVFKWFLASLLFGAPIRESSAAKTYRCFRQHNVMTPKRVLDTGWDGLVKILDEGGYTRYDFKTADKLLQVTQNLVQNHRGSLTVLHSEAKDSRDLERRLKVLGKGIGDVTISIFLRELRGRWEKADPKPTPTVVAAAEELKIIKRGTEEPLAQLKKYWARSMVQGESFVNFETALFRFGKTLTQKRKR